MIKALFSTRNKKRLVFLILTTVSCFLYKNISKPLSHDSINLIFSPKTSSYDIAEELAKNNVIKSSWEFLIRHWLTFPKKTLIAGEYLFNTHSSCQQILHQIQSGKVVIRKITIPEGWTVSQVIDLLTENEFLQGEIINFPKEGSVLPETYLFTRGENRQVVLNRMCKAMTDFVQKLWKDFKNHPCFIKTPEMLLILASIIEKETGIKSERPRIAAVFLNRLKLKMPLQSDPTVIYGLTLGKKILNRSLSRNDLASLSIYNTYKIMGLPPQPIACPGKESLKSVLYPLITKELYFVANGEGGHNFSETLEQHNRHVAQWRKINR